MLHQINLFVDTITDKLPAELIDFALVTIFSLIIGLSQRKLYKEKEHNATFGTDRTFTFVGILSFILYQADSSLVLYMGGGLIFGALLVVNYFHKINKIGTFGTTSIIIGLITYSLPVLIDTQPLWLFLLVVVIILILTELKSTLFKFSNRFNEDEFLTLGKFIIIAGVILPVLPNEPMVDFVEVTPYKIWLAVVVISSISYFSYLVRKFLFHNSGVLITGILGGLYSSTAATFVLARKSKSEEEPRKIYAAAMILASAMMYVRILILLYIFNKALFSSLLWPFAILIAVSLGIGVVMVLMNKEELKDNKVAIEQENNPLEFKVAILFTLLYVFFTFVTYYTLEYFGTSGLKVLSFVVGVTDIDPFLLNLFQGTYDVALRVLAIATLQAIISNNILKMGYGLWLTHKKLRKSLVISFGSLIVANIVVALVFYAF